MPYRDFGIKITWNLIEPIGLQPRALPKFSGLIESISCHRIALDISLPQSLDRNEILESTVKKILTHQARKIVARYSETTINSNDTIFSSLLSLSAIDDHPEI